MTGLELQTTEIGGRLLAASLMWSLPVMWLGVKNLWIKIRYAAFVLMWQFLTPEAEPALLHMIEFALCFFFIEEFYRAGKRRAPPPSKPTGD